MSVLYTCLLVYCTWCSRGFFSGQVKFSADKRKRTKRIQQVRDTPYPVLPFQYNTIVSCSSRSSSSSRGPLLFDSLEIPQLQQPVHAIDNVFLQSTQRAYVRLLIILKGQTGISGEKLNTWSLQVFFIFLPFSFFLFIPFDQSTYREKATHKRLEYSIAVSCLFPFIEPIIYNII